MGQFYNPMNARVVKDSTRPGPAIFVFDRRDLVQVKRKEKAMSATGYDRFTLTQRDEEKPKQEEEQKAEEEEE